MIQNKEKFKLWMDGDIKRFRSENYNWDFNTSTGFMCRWGKNFEDDPEYSPYGFELADIEISASAPGGGGCPVSCPMCYKGNGSGSKQPVNMSLETFKKIFEKFPKYNGIYYVHQVALGLLSVGVHPELFDILQYCRDNGVVPNLTINGSDPLTDEQIDKLVSLCGAMAISVVPPRQEKAYDLIQRLIKKGANQLNIHFVIHQGSIQAAYQVCNDMKTDTRLKGLNAIVFLGLKPKGRGEVFKVLETGEYVKLVNFCLENGIPFGSDSCGAPKVELAVRQSNKLTTEQKEQIVKCIERCESGNFSFYCNVEGLHYPCSFGEDIETPINLLEIKDFIKDVWESKISKQWRQKLFGFKRECPLYSEIRI